MHPESRRTQLLLKPVNSLRELVSLQANERRYNFSREIGRAGFGVRPIWQRACTRLPQLSSSIKGQLPPATVSLHRPSPSQHSRPCCAHRAALGPSAPLHTSWAVSPRKRIPVLSVAAAENPQWHMNASQSHNLDFRSSITAPSMTSMLSIPSAMATSPLEGRRRPSGRSRC